MVLDITGKRCRGYHRRRRDPIWKDGEHVTIFRYVGDEQFQRTKLCNVWKTIGSFRRNVLFWLKLMLKSRGYHVEDHRADNLVVITLGETENFFYIFGGKDERSQDLIQGLTLAGVFFDEVALMPESFVNQATGRCSVDGSKYWFNCNPDHPYHWFYREWICKAAEKNALYLHFTMEDNLSLTPRIRARYRRLYAGVFYDRFILGKWTASSGLVYPMFRKDTHLFTEPPACSRFVVSCDYGTVNPTSMGLWGESGGVWYRLGEYYYASRQTGISRTDEEHYTALEQLCSGRTIDCVVIDPSAASFMECIRRHGRFRVIPAKNDVLSGIRRVSDALKSGRIRIHASCKDCIREFSLYQWNEKAGGDVPLKEHDHAMDDLRYFVSTILAKEEKSPFFVASLTRDRGMFHVEHSGEVCEIT